MPLPKTRSTKLDLRLTTDAKSRLAAAAKLRDQTVTQFVLESALGRANETLAERQHFGLDATRWTEFMQALDAPPRDLPRLRRLFHEPSLFETAKRG